jgi:hypothetical protein
VQISAIRTLVFLLSSSLLVVGMVILVFKSEEPKPITLSLKHHVWVYYALPLPERLLGHQFPPPYVVIVKAEIKAAPKIDATSTATVTIDNLAIWNVRLANNRTTDDRVPSDQRTSQEWQVLSNAQARLSDGSLSLRFDAPAALVTQQLFNCLEGLRCF